MSKTTTTYQTKVPRRYRELGTAVANATSATIQDMYKDAIADWKMGLEPQMPGPEEYQRRLEQALGRTLVRHGRQNDGRAIVFAYGCQRAVASSLAAEYQRQMNEGRVKLDPRIVNVKLSRGAMQILYNNSAKERSTAAAATHEASYAVC